jgi:hypothetical protein
MRDIRCFFNFHDLMKDEAPINGVWWAFCRRCGARYAGEYDMATGETIWRPR